MKERCEGSGNNSTTTDTTSAREHCHGEDSPFLVSKGGGLAGTQGVDHAAAFLKKERTAFSVMVSKQ